MASPLLTEDDVVYRKGLYCIYILVFFLKKKIVQCNTKKQINQQILKGQKHLKSA